MGDIHRHATAAAVTWLVHCVGKKISKRERDSHAVGECTGSSSRDGTHLYATVASKR